MSLAISSVNIPLEFPISQFIIVIINILIITPLLLLLSLYSATRPAKQSSKSE